MRMIEKPELQISDKVAGIPEALSVYMNNVVYAMKRRDIPIVTLSLGEAYFDIQIILRPAQNFKSLAFMVRLNYPVFSAHFDFAPVKCIALNLIRKKIQEWPYFPANTWMNIVEIIHGRHIASKV